MRIRHRAALSVSIIAAFLGTTAAFSDAEHQCLRDASRELRLCSSNCREGYQAARDACRNIDHDCADQCRDALEVCLDGPNGPITRLVTCRLNCEEALVAAKATCREQFPADTPGRDNCIDQAQATAFACRDSCREGVSEQVHACRVSARTCIIGCPPPAGP